MTISCRHSLTSAVGDFPGDVADPDGLLVGIEPDTLVTMVVDVTAPEGQLVVREVYPFARSPYATAADAAVISRLENAGMTMWFGEEHAARAGSTSRRSRASPWRNRTADVCQVDIPRIV